MSTQSPTDIKLLFQQIATGDDLAFRQLFERYRSKIYFFILHITENETEAEELVQDVFTRIWSSRHALDKVENPDAYLFVMAKNRSLDFIQRAASDRKMKAGFAQKTGFAENTTEEDIDLRESKRLIDEAVRQLPPQQELVYKMSKEEGLSRQEIAKRLNLSENTVKNHLSEAIKFIKNWLNDYGDTALLLILWHSL